MIFMEEDQRSRPVLAREDWASGQKITMDGTNKPVTLPAGCVAAEVTNDSGVTIFARGDGTAATSGGAATKPVFSKSWRVVFCRDGLNLIGTSGDVYVMPYRSAP